MDFVQKSEQRRGSSVDKHPEFLNPQKERELEKLWKGEAAPNLLAPFLPPGVTFVGHQLKGSTVPGVVKVEQPNGDVLILRVEMSFKGKIVATNVTVTAQALYGNLERFRKGEKLWLIGPDATAAMDWGHGGGTKTTGGHTADTMLNYLSKYNVFTVGMDQPFHGEGPREWFKDDKEYFEFRAAFREQFIHPDVPTFLVGHSKGGLVGDMAVRRSTQYPFIKKAYAGVIPLSFVADSKPGGSYKEKTIQERMTDMERKWDDNEKRVNEGDLDLFASLMSKDKTSALSGLFCSFLSLYNNWAQDCNLKGIDGDGPVPSLYVMGEHDSLYVLNEENIETYVRGLKNSTLWTFTSRVTFRGEVDKIGHMIFDHYLPKKDHPEAVNVMREYLLAQDANMNLPEDEESLQNLFKTQVLSQSTITIDPYTYNTPVNNYSSTLVLMAYQWVPNFTKFLTDRIETQAKASGKSLREFQKKYFIAYSEENVFETYQIIRDFVNSVLKTQGKELKELTAKARMENAQAANDPMANSRESILSVLKTYGNNLAFREFLNELTLFDVNAKESFQKLNEMGQTLTQRIKAIENIRKEKISDEEKAQKISALEPIADDQGVELASDDVKAMQAALSRIHEIRNKRYVPTDERQQFAQTNVKERDELAEQIKKMELQRDDQKKKLKELKDSLSQKENAFYAKTEGATSPKLLELEQRRGALYSELESYDFKQRDVLEAYLAKNLDEQAPWTQALENLPPELAQLFLDTEKASQTYQTILREIDGAEISEALAGALGPEVKELADEVFGANGLQKQVQDMTNQIDEMEYVQLGSLRDQKDKLLEEYVLKVLPQYFTPVRTSLTEVLNTDNSSNEAFKEQFKALEKALSMWRARVLTSKPNAEGASLY